MATGTGQRNKPAENYKSMVKWLRLLETPVSQRICLFCKNHFNKSTFFLPYLNFKTSCALFFVRIHNGARYDFISSQASQDPWMNSFGN